MKRCTIVLFTLLAMLIMPSMAQAACNVGVTNGVSVAPPTPVYPGQTQTQNYMITACTQTARVTVEWVKVIDSNRPFMLNAANRDTVTGEMSVGTAMIGTSSWTVPANVVPGHYGVIARYYPVGAQAPEAVAASSFLVGADMCPNIAGPQPTVPNNLHLVAGNCVADECPNIVGVQTAIPNGLVKDGAGNCVTDECPNVVGVQTAVPNGLVKDGAGNCVTDECPNLIGIQTAVPNGLVKDGAGNCVTDECPNLAGIQTTVPNGMLQNAAGDCYLPPVIIPPVVQPPTPDPVCLNIPTMTLAQATAAGLTIDAAGNCTETATPQGKIGAPKLGITKVGNRKIVRQGGVVKFTIIVRNTGDAASGKTRVCDIFPAGMTYISNTGRGSAFNLGKLCWTVPNIAAGQTIKVGIVTVKITKPSGRVVNTACIMAHPIMGNSTKLCAKAPVVVRGAKPEPGGGVTG